MIGHDDLGLRLDAARQVARIRIHVVDDDRRLFGGGGAADAAAERNARVRRRLADERAEHELVAVEQVDPDPGVVGRCSRGADRCFHRRVASALPPARRDRPASLVSIGHQSLISQNRASVRRAAARAESVDERVQPAELDAGDRLRRATTGRRLHRPRALDLRRQHDAGIERGRQPSRRDPEADTRRRRPRPERAPKAAAIRWITAPHA